jgi:hypothetical protein
VNRVLGTATIRDHLQALCDESERHGARVLQKRTCNPVCTIVVPRMTLLPATLAISRRPKNIDTVRPPSRVVDACSGEVDGCRGSGQSHGRGTFQLHAGLFHVRGCKELQTTTLKRVPSYLLNAQCCSIDCLLPCYYARPTCIKTAIHACATQPQKSSATHSLVPMPPNCATQSVPSTAKLAGSTSTKLYKMMVYCTSTAPSFVSLKACSRASKGAIS